MKLAIVAWLYLWCIVQYFKYKDKPAPDGVHGEHMLNFVERPGAPKHGVVAFVLPKGKTPDDYSLLLWGPAGLETNTSWHIFRKEWHAYGRDDWGVPTEEHTRANPKLRRLAQDYPGQIIVLAGVRRLWRWHLWPLNNPDKFVQIPLH